MSLYRHMCNVTCSSVLFLSAVYLTVSLAFVRLVWLGKRKLHKGNCKNKHRKHINRSCVRRISCLCICSRKSHHHRIRTYSYSKDVHTYARMCVSVCALVVNTASALPDTNQFRRFACSTNPIIMALLSVGKSFLM